MTLVWRSGIRVGCALLSALLAQVALADPSPPSEPLWFDIPAMPLSRALDVYAERTGIAVLVDSELTRQRYSSLVRGRYSATDALSRLLRGTGLAAVYGGRAAFTLTPAPAPPNRPLSRPGLGGESYAARLQRVLDGALCAQPITRDGGFRSAVQLWIDDEGRIQKLHFLSFSGEARRDRAIASLLYGLRPGPPDRVLPNPLTVLIERAGDGRDCR